MAVCCAQAKCLSAKARVDESSPIAKDAIKIAGRYRKIPEAELQEETFLGKSFREMLLESETLLPNFRSHNSKSTM